MRKTQKMPKKIDFWQLARDNYNKKGLVRDVICNPFYRITKQINIRSTE
jgi:hypothetical protein